MTSRENDLYVQVGFQNRIHRLLEGQTMVTGSEECRFLSRVEGNMSRVEGRGRASRSRVKKKCFFVRSRFFHILGFHLTSGTTKIKNFGFLILVKTKQFQ